MAIRLMVIFFFFFFQEKLVATMSREELDPASNAEEAVSDVRTKCKSSAHHSALWAKVVLNKWQILYMS